MPLDCTIPTGPEIGRIRIFRQCGRELAIAKQPCGFDTPERPVEPPEPTFPDLAVSQALTPDQFTFTDDDLLVFTITVQNLGDAPALGSQLVWSLPSFSLGATIELGDLPVGYSGEVVVNVTIPLATGAGSHTLTSTVSTASEEPNLTNNSAATDFETVVVESVTDISAAIEELVIIS